MNNNLKSEPLMFIQTVKIDNKNTSNQLEFDSRNKGNKSKNDVITPLILKIKKLQKLDELGFDVYIKVNFSNEKEAVGKHISYDKEEIIFCDQTYHVEDIDDISIDKVDF